MTPRPASPKAPASVPIGSFDDKVLSRDEICLAFQLLLQRDPAEDQLNRLCGRAVSLGQLRAQLLSSVEFSRKLASGQVMPSTDPVSDQRPRLVHLHIPKTAGTSLNTKLLAQYPRSETVDAYGSDPTRKLRAMSASDRDRIRLVAGHCAHGVHRLLSGPVQYLCILREPTARLLSYYRFIMRTKVAPALQPMVDSRPDFGTFLEMSQTLPNLRFELDNGQMRRLAGQMNAPELTKALYDRACRNLEAENMLFGLTEDFGDVLRRMVARGFLPDAEELHANAASSPGTPDQIQDALTKDQAALLARFTRWDDQLYAHARALLAPRTTETSHAQ